MKSTIVYLPGIHIYNELSDGNNDEKGKYKSRIEIEIPLSCIRAIKIEDGELTVQVYEKDAPDLYKWLESANQVEFEDIISPEVDKIMNQ